jgi:hypothetical protein
MRARQRPAYESYAMYRDHLRDMLDGDAAIRRLNGNRPCVDPKHLAGLWDAMSVMSEAANEEADQA